MPFFDYPAHLSVPAALRLRSDPATGISALWDFNLRIVPNCLHYALTYLGSLLVSIETASRVFVAVFCVAALPLSAVVLLRAFGRDWRLAALVVPLAWNRCLWYGFIDFCAALPLGIVGLALLERDLARPSLRRELGLGFLFGLLPFAHFFVMALTGLAGATLILARGRRLPVTRLLRTATPLAAGPILMAPWFLGALHAGPPASRGAVLQMFAARPHAATYAALLRHWFMDGYTAWFDDALAIVMLATLAALFVFVHRAPRAAAAAESSGATRLVPLIVSGSLAVTYLALPFELKSPFHWWAMNVRVLPFLFVWLVAAVPPGALDRTGRLLLLPVTLATAAYLAYVAVDVRQSFNGPWGMAGLAEVLAHAPKGARVLGLYTDYRQRPHYAHYPFQYASSYSVLTNGGLAAPRNPIPQSWTDPRAIPDFPMAGDAALFRFSRHAAGFSHFLVRTCEGEGCVPDPLEGRPDTRLLAQSSRWRLYAKE